VLAYFLHDFSPFIVKFGNGFGLRWYGLAYVLAFLCGYGLYKRLAERGYTDMPPAQVGDFITWAAVFGVMIGGRIGWIVFYGIGEEHVQDPWYWPFEVWKGGMASHGGILGLVLFTLFYSHRQRISWTSIGDSLVTVAPVGLFIVRCANFVNGELWGKPSSVPWAVQFPTELPEDPTLSAEFAQRYPTVLGRLDSIEGVVRAAQHSLLNPFAHQDQELAQALRDVLPPRHPSQLYEAGLEGLLLFAILWIMRTRLRLPRGVLTGVFFVLYALLRIVGEIFRVPDPHWAVGALSAGQFLSLFMFLIGGAFIAWGFKTRQYERVFLARSAAVGDPVD
jgi:phosphatidylglycerol---prolipoprotein diacylglyceryl transferase